MYVMTTWLWMMKTIILLLLLLLLLSLLLEVLHDYFVWAIF